MLPPDSFPKSFEPLPGNPVTIRTVVTIEASVIRADGTVEDLGVIASSEDGSAQMSMLETEG